MTKFLRLRSIILLLISALCLMSCKPGPPDGVLGAGKMEDVLYDYHMAQAMAQQMPGDSIAYYTRLYQEAVFMKYGITQSDFDKSMIWYERHADKLGKIYARLSERMGGSVDVTNNALLPGLQTASGDTLNVWQGPSSILLNSQGVNRFVYTQRADTAIKSGDRLVLMFNVEWFYHEGEHRVMMYATIHYAGDSVTTMQQFVFMSGSQQMQTTIGKGKVTSIELFAYQCAPWDNRARIVSLSNLRMYRVRGQQVERATSTPSHGDSVPRRPVNFQRRLRDSLMRSDTANERKPHFV